jgi:hypothetical protein
MVDRLRGWGTRDLTFLVHAKLRVPQTDWICLKGSALSTLFREEPVRLKINKGKAKLLNELPRVEIFCPVQNFQKSFRVRDLMKVEGRMDTNISPLCKALQKRNVLFS